VADLKRALEAVAARVEQQLDALLPAVPGAGGRVFLAIQCARLFDVPEDQALRAAAAVEMVHCYSLIHDDLPAMDDSDLRRGRATSHMAFDEATAILAGDGLLTEAFAVLADPGTHADPAVRAELVAGLAAAAGAAGMVGGQMIDISPARARLDLAGITALQSLKTGALITFSCDAGAILGAAPEAERGALRAYAADLGLAFQIADDLLDAEGTAEELGKPTGQDSAQGKATFVGLLGAEGARAKAVTLINHACARLDLFGEKADLLRETAQFVVHRRS
jgi:farnesyl diphosphate synthase